MVLEEREGGRTSCLPQAATGFAFICVTTSPTRRPMPAPRRQDNLIAAFAGLRCLPYARRHRAGATDRPSFLLERGSRIEDRPLRASCWWARRGGAQTIPSSGQGLSRSPCATSAWSARPSWPAGRDPAAFRPYVEERLERMRRLRITASLAATLRAELARRHACDRQRAGRRMRVDKMLSPMPASLVGPEKLPAAASNGPRSPRCSRPDSGDTHRQRARMR